MFSGLTEAPILALHPDTTSLPEISHSLTQSISKRKLQCSTLHCKIPSAFRKHILNELSIRATLTLSSSADKLWNVRVHKTERNIYLKEGWQEFLRDNAIGDSEFLVFGYDGNMHFSIDIYERTGCKRTVAPAIQGHQRSTFTNNTKRLCGRPRKSGTAAEHTANGESSNNTKRHRGRQRVSDNAAEHVHCKW
uniref:B3 domain-containing protein Os01g0723500-like n=1 Tax=Fragaria vesca subsp. vesca TaxID=101020 RepID=UPI0005C8C796|nr:PREDICTED: B3 domain-containing protein Os01g0723500-like [Fragaria vesca subsp. vesca]